MTRAELKQWLRDHIRERLTWDPRTTVDSMWINWASKWLDDMEREDR